MRLNAKLNEAATLLHWNIKEAHVFCQECSFEEEEVCFLTIELVLMSGLSAHPSISWISPEHFSKLGQAREIEPN